MLTFQLVRAIAALASLVSENPVDFSKAPTVSISLSSFDIAPSIIRLDAGKPVVLHIRNASGQGHDFTAPGFFAAALFRTPDARSLSEGAIKLLPGQETFIALVPHAGTYLVKCARPFHKMFGMSGTIVVSQ